MTSTFRRAASWLAALVLAYLLVPSAHAGDRYALLVGVKNYNKNELHNLNYSENDVTELAVVLREGGYKRVVLMTQSEANSQGDNDLLPTSDNIRAHLKGILEGRKADDMVLVAFSGHGVQLKGKKEHYFCPMDAKLASSSTLISLPEVYDQLAACKAGAKVMLVDACRNDPQAGLSKSADRPEIELPSDTRPQATPAPGGVAVVFSCSESERSFESEKLKHGIFFNFIIEGLRGKAANDRGEIGLDGLAQYVKDQVPDRVKSDVGPDKTQVPQSVNNINGSLTLLTIKVTINLPPGPGGETKTIRAEDGSRFFARWEADGFSYPCTVDKVENGKSHIRYSDGNEEWAPSSRVGKCNIRVGDVVYGNWLNKGLYYPGKVSSRNNDRIHIVYDDGDEEDTTIGLIRMKLEHADAKEVGCRIFGRWAADGFWYPGTVKEIKDGKYFIRFDDKDTAWLDAQEIVGYQPTFDDHIQGDWLGKGKFYDGKITKRQGEKVHILYDDGDEEDTTISYLRADYDGKFHPQK